MWDIHDKEDEKNAQYYYERFENVETKILSVSKRILVRLRYNKFEFWVKCGISKVWVVT